MGDQFVTHLPISDHLMTTGRAYAKDQFWGSMKSNLEEIILNIFLMCPAVKRHTIAAT